MSGIRRKRVAGQRQTPVSSSIMIMQIRQNTQETLELVEEIHRHLVPARGPKTRHNS